MKKLNIVWLAPVLALYAGMAQSALVDFVLSGDITSADAGNGFGVSAGDTITVTGTFDDSLLTGSGNETVFFDAASGNSLSFSLGSQSFTQMDDVDYGAGGAPKLTFTDGSFTGFQYLAEFGSYGYFSSVGTLIDAGDDNFFNNYVGGSWVQYSLRTPVPVPAALWLFGSGLLGLAGIARRKP